MKCLPIEALQFLITLGFIGFVIVMIFMYLDGYWTPERVYRRWVMGDSFTAIDERHRLGINRDGSKISRK